MRARLARAFLFMALALGTAWLLHSFLGVRQNVAAENLPSLVTILPEDAEIAEAIARRLDRERRRFAGRLLVVSLERGRDAEMVARLGPETGEAIQIFLGADGREIGRRAGVLGTGALVEHWRTLGVDLTGDQR